MGGREEKQAGAAAWLEARPPSPDGLKRLKGSPWENPLPLLVGVRFQVCFTPR
jgi:hypothetical protein